MNTLLVLLFPEAIVTHLNCTHLDYCPILLSLQAAPSTHLPRPFRFESMWLSHHDFPDIVDKAWSLPATNLSMFIVYFTSLVLSWNKHTFGNIFQRKKRVLARINGAQRALSHYPSLTLISLEASLRKEFHDILKLEEDFWALKSRVGWVVEGDRNTKFFHTSTIIRRRFNKILRLKNFVREWIEGSD